MPRPFSRVPKLSSAEIAFRIKRLHEEGEALNIAAVREKHPELLLAAYSQRTFLGWRRALELAGLDYSQIKIHLPRYVVCEECKRKLQTLFRHVLRVHAISIEQYRTAHPGAEPMSPAYEAKLFGFRSRQDRLPHWEPHWSPEYVLDRVYQFHMKGIPLDSGKMKELDEGVVRRGLRYFRSWETVLKLVGLDPKKIIKGPSPTRYTRAEVVQTLRARHERGQDVSFTGMINSDRKIARVAVRLFGSYDQAIHACGLESSKIRRTPKPPRKYKTETNVIDEICRRRFVGQPIFDTGVSCGMHRDLSLYNKGRRLFGSWRAAIEAAGFLYEKITQKAPKYPTPADVVSAMRLRLEQKLPLTTIGVRRGAHRDNNLYEQGRKFFGDWAGTLKAAGICRCDVVSS